MTNKDFIGLAVVAVFLVVIFSFMKNKPAVVVGRDAPLPTNLYTNGARSNAQSNNVASRVNFHQQPVGNNYS
jgi:hypothetical protein